MNCKKKVCGGKCSILSIFDGMNGVLISKLDFNNLFGKSILLNELIHGLQYISDSDLSPVFRENEAYEIQNKFLHELSREKKFKQFIECKKM